MRLICSWADAINANTKSPTRSNDEKFSATCIFTKETLPVGSVIEINAGWLYRAEYWKSYEGQSARGPLVSTYRVVVTEDFWANGVTERAFNISKASGESSLNYDWSEVASAFKIYVPAN